MPQLTGIVETSLYVADPEISARFYEDLLGFRRLATDYRLCALAVAPGQVLLLFRRGASRHLENRDGRVIPGHDGSGEAHLAFSITVSDLQAWEKKLAERNIPIESRVQWELGGTSLYFRDPDGHSVELATPGVWANY